MGFFSNVAQYFLVKRRERIVDRREILNSLSSELDQLANLMSSVLEVTSPDGQIQQEKLPELDILRKQVWNRWITIVESRAYEKLNPEIKEDIEECITIAEAAPGAYVEEVFLLQKCISNGSIDQLTRTRFMSAIGNIRDLTTKLRLNHP